MAEYFLAKCPSYQKEVGSQQYKRRAVVCKHLNSDYKAGRDKEDATFSIVQTELQEEDIDISRYQYQHDKVVLRNAFLYLNCPDDESRNEFFAKLTMTKSAILGIRYLRTDGITTWEELLVASQSSARVPVPPEPKKLSLEDHQAGRAAIAAFSSLAECFEGMLTENQVLQSEIERQREELDGMVLRTKDHDSTVLLLEDWMIDIEKQLEGAKELVRNSHTANLENLVKQHPEIPELQIALNKIKQQPTKKEDLIAHLLTLLPVKYVWGISCGAVTYKKSFLHALCRLTRDEQTLLVQHVKTVISIDPHHHGALDSKKVEYYIPYSPAGSMQSRASQSIRFSWKKNDEITFYWIWMKGESRVRVSEA